MPIDAYSLCPGGTGKKIKFCCPDFVGELEKIDRMIDGDQHVACLQHIDRLLKEGAPRACLLATKGMLLRATGQVEEAAANAALFVEKHPNNPTALAESAILAAATEGGRAAMPKLQQAMGVSAEGISSRVYDALGMLAQVMLSEGHWLSGRALLQLQMAIAHDDEQPVEMILGYYRSTEVPLLFKEDAPMPVCPADAPWKARFDEARAPVAFGRWQAAADRLTALAGTEGANSPEVWRNLATLRGWLADSAGCIEALRKYAAFDVPLEDAVEAATLAMLLDENPLGDQEDVLTVTWTVRDPEKLQTGLLSDQRVVQVPFDPRSFTEEDSPPPRGVYLLLDRPMPASAEGLAAEAMPNFLGQALFFGRQTDREARIEVLGLTAADLPQTAALLQALAGDAIDLETKQEVVGKVSASQELLQHKWRPPRDITRQQLQALTIEFQRDALLAKWPDLKLGALDGKSPREAAADPACRVRALAAVMLLSSWNEHLSSWFDFNELRSRLGLPTLDPIHAQKGDVERLPLIRLTRLVVEELDDESLLTAYRRAVAFGATPAMRKLAKAVIERPDFPAKEDQLKAYGVLARSCEDGDEALGYVDRGRNAAEAAGRPGGHWDLFELSLRFGRGEVREAIALVGHIEQRHMEEPGVAEALTRMLIQVGLLRPDGTPATMPRSPQEAALAEPAAAPGELWTPDGQQPAGKGKLWVPE